jgi:hypothetical protein
MSHFIDGIVYAGVAFGFSIQSPAILWRNATCQRGTHQEKSSSQLDDLILSKGYKVTLTRKNLTEKDIEALPPSESTPPSPTIPKSLKSLKDNGATVLGTGKVWLLFIDAPHPSVKLYDGVGKPIGDVQNFTNYPSGWQYADTQVCWNKRYRLFACTYKTQSSLSEVGIISLRTRQYTKLTTLQAPLIRLHWDNADLLVLSASRTKRAITRVDVKTRSSKSIYSEEVYRGKKYTLIDFPHFIAPDGKKVILYQGENLAMLNTRTGQIKPVVRSKSGYFILDGWLSNTMMDLIVRDNKKPLFALYRLYVP